MSSKTIFGSSLLLGLSLLIVPASAQDNASPNNQQAVETEATNTTAADLPSDDVVVEQDAAIVKTDAKPAKSTVDKVSDGTAEMVDSTQKRVGKLAEDVDKDQTAVEVKDNILQPIYSLAEALNFSAFHWLAFTFMVSGVVSFALQLVIGKLVAMAKLGFSFMEILGDLQGLIISLVGLVLTTQAASENSSFTRSAFSVLSATIVGTIFGLIFYWYGQQEELQAIDARRLKARIEAAKADAAKS